MKAHSMPNKSVTSYPSIAKFFHWAIALMIFFNLASGVILIYYRSFSLSIELFDIHKQFGTMILFLALLRLLWRFTHKYPSLDGIIPKHEQIIASLGHLALYILMFAIPISGIFMSQAFGKNVYFLFLKLPIVLSTPSKELAMQFLTLHKYLAIGIALIVGGHATAALKHHIVDKNDILLRMLPSRGRNKK